MTLPLRLPLNCEQLGVTKASGLNRLVPRIMSLLRGRARSLYSRFVTTAGLHFCRGIFELTVTQRNFGCMSTLAFSSMILGTWLTALVYVSLTQQFSDNMFLIFLGYWVLVW